jgi:AmiR/NasT family two-component response regulator
MGEQGMLIEQLQSALTSRVIIEQAKGMLAERTGLSTEQAFAALRRHARAGNHRLSDLARAVIDGTAEIRL